MNIQRQRFGGDWTEQKLECVRKYSALPTYNDHE